MTKADFTLLSRIFDAETRDLLPFQSRAKGYQALAADGMITHMTRMFGPTEVHGWALTERGRILYCEECSRRE